jgi:hypothetical protein
MDNLEQATDADAAPTLAERLELIRELYAIDQGRHPLWRVFITACLWPVVEASGS